MKNIMKEAHRLTKLIIKKGDSYKATFRLCLSFAHSKAKKVAKTIEYRTSRGHEVSVKVGEGITVENLTVNGIKVIENNNDKYRCLLCKGYIYVALEKDYKKIGATRPAQITYNKEMDALYEDVTIERKLKDRKEEEKALRLANMQVECKKHEVFLDRLLSDINFI